jgi:hypothetical protein
MSLSRRLDRVEQRLLVRHVTGAAAGAPLAVLLKGAPLADLRALRDLRNAVAARPDIETAMLQIGAALEGGPRPAWLSEEEWANAVEHLRRLEQFYDEFAGATQLDPGEVP